MDIKKVINKANIKETVVLVIGNTSARYADNLINRFIQDENQRAAAKVGIGLVGAYAFNELAERYPRYSEAFALAGLAMSAIAAQPISDKLTEEIAAATGTPLVVVSRGVEMGTEVVEKKKPRGGISVGR